MRGAVLAPLQDLLHWMFVKSNLLFLCCENETMANIHKRLKRGVENMLWIAVQLLGEEENYLVKVDMLIFRIFLTAADRTLYKLLTMCCTWAARQVN